MGKDIYVVLNTSEHRPGQGDFYIMNDDGITLGNLKDACDVIVSAMIEHQHDLNTARLFKLTEVPFEEYQGIVKERYDDATSET